MLGVFGLSDMPPFCCDHRVKKMAKKTLEQKPVGRICENRCENRGTFSNVFVIPWARPDRVVAADVAHNVTQRGNACQYILTSDTAKRLNL
jgi:hypothetical protein